MKNGYAAFAVLVLMSSSALAQAPLAPPAPAAAQPVVAAVAPAPAAPEQATATLPANTEVVLTLNEAASSENLQLGDKVALSVSQDVKVNGSVLIPRGTRAVSQVTMHKGKGSFGKSGKLELTFRYLDLDSHHIPLDGRYFQEGAGNTGATVGAVLAAGVIGGLIVHGRSARIAEGHEFTARTIGPVPVMLPASPGSPALIAASYTPGPVSMEVMTDKQRKAAEKAAGKAGQSAHQAAAKK